MVKLIFWHLILSILILTWILFGFDKNLLKDVKDI